MRRSAACSAHRVKAQISPPGAQPGKSLHPKNLEFGAWPRPNLAPFARVENLRSGRLDSNQILCDSGSVEPLELEAVPRHRKR